MTTDQPSINLNDTESDWSNDLDDVNGLPPLENGNLHMDVESTRKKTVILKISRQHIR